ncbi:MAG: hypothetical protein ACFB21_14225 [Opitutales bacterium]
MKRFSAYAVLVLLVLGLGNHVAAQSVLPRARRVAPEAPEENSPGFRFEEDSIDLDFPGGSVYELIEAVREAGADELRVVVPFDASDIEIAAIHAQNVPWARVFQFATQAAAVEVPLPGSRRVNGSVGYAFQYQHGVMVFSSGKLETPALPSDSKVYELSKLSETDLESLLNAIREGWATQPQLIPEEVRPFLSFDPESDPTLHYDDGSKTLIVTGSERRVQLAHELVNRFLPPEPSEKADKEGANED